MLRNPTYRGKMTKKSLILRTSDNGIRELYITIADYIITKEPESTVDGAENPGEREERIPQGTITKSYKSIRPLTRERILFRGQEGKKTNLVHSICLGSVFPLDEETGVINTRCWLEAFLLKMLKVMVIQRNLVGEDGKLCSHFYLLLSIILNNQEKFKTKFDPIIPPF